MDAKSDAKQTAKTALLNTTANMISLIVGMVMIPVITRILSTEDMGVATTFISTRNTLVILFTLAVYAYVNKAMLEFKGEKKNYIYTMVVFCSLSIVAAFLVLSLFKKEIQRLLSLDDFLYYWLFISCYILAVYTIANCYCAFHNQYIKVALMVLALGTLSPIVSAVLSYLFPTQKYIGRVIGIDLAYIVVTIIVIFWLLFIPNKKLKKKYVSRTLRFTVPVIPHLLSQMVLTQCDLIMINYFEGKEKTGIYSMGHTVGYLALSVVTQIMVAWSPWVYRRFEEKNIKAVYQNSKLIILLGTYISLGLLTISTEVIQIFLTKDYRPCIFIVPPLVVAMHFQFIYLFFYDIEYYNKKAKWIATASVAASVLNLVLNWLCIPAFGYIAACYTTVASYLVLLVLNYLFCKRLDVTKIYDIRYMIFWVIAVIIYAVVMLAFRQWVLVRYVLFGVLTLLFIVWKYKDFKVLIASLKK